jgi:hypothetical protein
MGQCLGYIPNGMQRRFQVNLEINIRVFRNRASAFGFSLLFLACGVHSQTLQGDWRGTLSSPPSVNLPLVFHLDAAGAGTVESSAQRFTAPLQYSVNGNKITITVPSISASYAATVNGNQMSGTWSQNGGTMPLALTKAGAPSPSGVQGDWHGTLSSPPSVNLPLVFHLGAVGTGTVDSTAQKFSAPLQYSVNGNKITITVPSISASYAATVNGNQMSGTWSQNGGTMPLSLSK